VYRKQVPRKQETKTNSQLHKRKDQQWNYWGCAWNIYRTKSMINAMKTYGLADLLSTWRIDTPT